MRRASSLQSLTPAREEVHIFHLLGTISASRQAEVLQTLDQNSQIGRNYTLLVCLSCVIATFGLVENSAAVIIGAMLIAPLMSSLVAFSLALVLGDLSRAGRALRTLVLGVALSIAITFVLGQVVSAGRFNFLEQLPDEILGRTHPTLFDLAIAFAGGAAAAYALAKSELSATLPGVAIATALMPPVCVIGIGLALGREDVAGGAALLFLANFVAIAFASSAVFISVGFRPGEFTKRRTVLPEALLISGALLLVVTIPLGLLTYRIAANARENTLIRATLEHQLAQASDSTLVDFETRAGPNNGLAIIATIRAPGNLTYDQSVQMQRAVAFQLQQPVALKLLVVLVTSLDPLVPPTPVPTPPLGATAVATISPVPSHPSEPSPVPSLTATSTATSTLTPLPTPTLTSTPTFTAPPTQTPVPTATPIAYAAIGGTTHQGANLRRAPGLSAIVVAVPDSVVVQRNGQFTTVDGLVWSEVTLPDGRIGWIADQFLVPYQTYVAPSG